MPVSSQSSRNPRGFKPRSNYSGGLQAAFTLALLATLCLTGSSHFIQNGMSTEGELKTIKPNYANYTSSGGPGIRTYNISTYASTTITKSLSTFVTTSTIAPTASSSTSLPNDLQTLNKTATEVNMPRAGVPPGPNFFYLARRQISCRTPEWVMENRVMPAILDPFWLTPNYPFKRNELGYWKHVIGYFRGLYNEELASRGELGDRFRPWAIDAIRLEQQFCHECDCPHKKELKTNPNSVNCVDKRTPLVCFFLYACECIQTLGNHNLSFRNGLHKEATYEDFLRAFSQIPPEIRDAPFNRDFRWPLPPGMERYSGQEFTFENVDRLMANIAPPNEPAYYLEGPGPELPGPQPQLGSANRSPVADPGELPPDHPDYDPFPADMDEYARQEARRHPIRPAEIEERVFGEDAAVFSPDVETFGELNDYRELMEPPFTPTGPPTRNPWDRPWGGGSGGGSGGFFNKRGAQPEAIDIAATRHIDEGGISGGSGDAKMAGIIEI
ncbi:hypothetical protein TWF718_006769 [Orbilia javanica]|uniref:Uncharacterized protein n=1 Tax=Orbilia javanica TaxID=47235 RepID=A0AAN8RHP8_9PEZI